MSMSTFWIILYVLVIASTVVIVLLENRNPLKALSWIIILILLPVLGLIFYFIFGKDTRGQRLISKSSYDRINQNAAPEEPIDVVTHIPDLGHWKLLSQLINRQTMASLLVADEIATFTDGISAFRSLFEDIEHAEDHIHIQTYRLLDDHTGIKVAKALIRKAKQGVVVRVLCDHVGSFTTSRAFFTELMKHGIEVHLILPVVFPELTSKVNYRNHRKVAVIDGHIGYLGGMNIADHYTIGSRLGKWRDTHFRVTGVAVNGLQAAFMTDWYVASRVVLSKNLFIDPKVYDRNSNSIPPNNEEAYLKAPKVYATHIQTFTSGPTGPFRTLLQVISKSIYEARSRVVIQTPYFLPNESLNKAIIGAALSGIDVILILPWESDSIFVKYAMQSYFTELLHAGVKIYRYDGSFLHSKLMTIDGEISFIGSANMDFRSLEHNFEVTSVVYDKAFAEMIEEVLRKDIEGYGTLIELNKWNKRAWIRKLTESILRLFAPLM